jgi:hypothetical protein
MEAVDALHAIERLVAVARSGPAVDKRALSEVTAILSRMSADGAQSEYKAQKLAAVREGFESWSAGGKVPAQLLPDIEKLRKVMARGGGGQD